MGAICNDEKISKKMTLYLLLFGLISGQTYGLQLSNNKQRKTLVLPLEQPKAESNPANRKIGRMSVKELTDFVQEKIEDKEEEWKNCGIGNFISPATKTCESCDKYCNNGANMEACGWECQVYYAILQQAISSKEQLKGDESDNNDAVIPLWIALVFIFVVMVILVVAMVLYNKILTKRQITATRKSLEEQMRGKMIQQATPDTTPDNTLERRPRPPDAENRREDNRRDDVEEALLDMEQA